MLDMGFTDDIESILESTPDDRQTVLFSATLPHADQRRSPSATSAIRCRSRSARARPKPATRRSIRQTVYVVQRAHKPHALGRILDIEAPQCGARVLPHTHRGRPAHRDDERARLPRRGAARRHGPGPARPCDGPPARRHRRTARRHRRRRPRARRRHAHPRRQLRRAVGRRRATCTASAASGGPGAKASAITLAEPREQRQLENIERLTKQTDHRREGADGRRPARAPDRADRRRRSASRSRRADLEDYNTVLHALSGERQRPQHRARGDQARARGRRRAASTSVEIPDASERFRNDAQDERPASRTTARAIDGKKRGKSTRTAERPRAAASDEPTRTSCTSASAARVACDPATSSARSPTRPDCRVARSARSASPTTSRVVGVPAGAGRQRHRRRWATPSMRGKKATVRRYSDDRKFSK